MSKIVKNKPNQHLHNQIIGQSVVSKTTPDQKPPRSKMIRLLLIMKELNQNRSVSKHHKTSVNRQLPKYVRSDMAKQQN